MQVSVNGTDLAGLSLSRPTMQGLLAGLRARGDIESDQVVVGLRVDGRDWSAAELDDGFDEPLAEGARVAVQTDGVRGHARRILADAGGMLDVLVHASHEVAAGLQQATPQEANRDLYRLLDAVHQLLGCLCQVQQTCRLQTGVAGGESSALDRLDANLAALQAHQEAGNWPGVGEEIEAGLATWLADLRPVVNSMAAEL